MYDLIVKVSTDLPSDVRSATKYAREQEAMRTSSCMALDAITINNDMAVEKEAPLCQDTGLPNFKIYVPVGINQIEMEKAIESAITRATKEAKLRSNAVDSLTGKNSGNNLGTGLPVIEFHQWVENYIDVKLMQKAAAVKTIAFSAHSRQSFQGLGELAVT